MPLTSASPRSITTSRALSVALGQSGGVSAPGVSGPIAEGETVTISWDGVNGFGAGEHNLQVYDDMRNGVAGQFAGENSAVIGTYINPGSGFGGEYSDLYSHSKGMSLKQFDGAVGAMHGSWLDIVASQQVLMSYWIFVPSGFGLPGMDNDAYTPGGSNYKLAWIGADQGSMGTEGKPDIVLPTNNVTDKLTLGGNESSMSSIDNYTQLSQVHTYGEWLWCCVLFDGVNNQITVKHLSKSKGLKEFNFSIPDIWGTTLPQEIAHVRFMGWLRTSASANCQLYYDDYYTATGSAAGGLVLIGDAPVFANCTDFAVQKITSRSNDTILATVQNGPFASLSGKYLFVLGESMNPVTYNMAESREIV